VKRSWLALPQWGEDDDYHVIVFVSEGTECERVRLPLVLPAFPGRPAHLEMTPAEAKEFAVRVLKHYGD